MSQKPKRTGRPGGRRLRRPSKVTPARWVAWLVLRRTFDEDAWTDRAFAAAAEQFELDGRERAFAQLLTYGTVQQAKRLDHVIATLGKRPLSKLDPPVLYALRIGMFELLVLNGAERDRSGDEVVPGGASAHAAVSQAVELVRGVVGERAVAFTNAILRRAQVDGATILGELDPTDDADLAVQLSMPQWLVAAARASHGQDGVDALAAQNEPSGHTTFRVNPAKASGADHASVPQRMRDAGVELAEPRFAAAAPLALDVAGSTGAASPFVSAGVLVAQSLASQLVTSALDPQPGERILDMCAAPGGKTTHIAALLDAGNERGEVVAVELHEHRAESVRTLAARLGLSDRVTVVVGDSTQLDPNEIGTFDRVLLDAPCSGTGVLGARPDARWKRSPEAIEELVELQRALLARAARLVRPGGVLVYSTCSILAAEDEQIVADVEPLGLVADELPEHFPEDLRTSGWQARTWPHRHATEGFFIARMRRSEETG